MNENSREIDTDVPCDSLDSSTKEKEINPILVSINDQSPESNNSNLSHKKVVSDFISITGTDENLAAYFLKDKEWNLERSIDAFFEAQGSEAASANDSDILVTFDGSEKSSSDQNIQTPLKFSLLSWNLDGLDHNNLKKRTKAVTKIIEKEKPDIVFLQEVIPVTYSYLDDHLSEYSLFSAGNEDYFTATLLRKSTVQFIGQTIHEYSGTVMNRNLLVIQCCIGSLQLKLLNTHLESTGQYSEERKNQLKQCFSLLQAKENIKETSIFGGDLNLRDKELTAVGLPSGVKDLWECCGKKNDCRFTWDMLKNTNKSSSWHYKPRARYDRVFLCNAEPRQADPFSFSLIGQEKLSEVDYFPSDHFGILVHFNIINQLQQPIGNEAATCSGLNEGSPPSKRRLTIDVDSDFGNGADDSVIALD